MCRSVAESSTTRIRLMPIVGPFRSPVAGWVSATIALALIGFAMRCRAPLRRDRAHVRRDRLQQAFLGEGLRQVLVRAHHPAARAIEEAVLGGEHHDGRRAEA